MASVNQTNITIGIMDLNVILVNEKMEILCDNDGNIITL